MPRGRRPSGKGRGSSSPGRAVRGRAAKGTRPAGGGSGRKAARAAPIRIPEGWRLDAGGRSISTQVRTVDFLEALDLIHEVGGVAEELEHHPDLHLERYNRLRITTYSHDVGRLTERDERLATRISELLAKRGLLP